MNDLHTEILTNKTLPELRELAREVERELAQREVRKRGEAVALVREVAADAGLTMEELMAICMKAKATRLPGERPAPKYRDPASGKEWTGLGRRPEWVIQALESGKSLNDLRIANS